jgi:hypothetical protein
VPELDNATWFWAFIFSLPLFNGEIEWMAYMFFCNFSICIIIIYKLTQILFLVMRFYKIVFKFWFCCNFGSQCLSATPWSIEEWRYSSPGTCQIGGWVGFKAGLHAVAKSIKSLTLPGIEPRLSSPYSSHYTDWALVLRDFSTKRNITYISRATEVTV